MKVIHANAKLIDRSSMSQLELVEYTGRICYKSHDRITKGSAEIFCKAMKKNKHMATLEHGWAHLQVDVANIYENVFDMFIGDAELFRYIEVSKINNPSLLKKSFLISGSFRGLLAALGSKYQNPVFAAIYNKLADMYPVIFDNEKYNLNENTDTVNIQDISPEDIAKIFDYISDPEERKTEIMKHSIITIVFTCDRGVSHEIVRHRPASYDQESTRYCDYSKEKFDKQISVIFPEEYKNYEIKYSIWHNLCEESEKAYFKLRELGATAQEARGVLPTDLKTEIAVTANEKEWQHIFNLRYHDKTGGAHPHMKHVMSKAFPQAQHASDYRII